MKKIVLVFLAIAIIALGAHAAFSYRNYNVILITIDTLRSDFLSCYNPKAPKTPNIDRIAAKGVLFKNAFALIPITLPSHASILTSRYPHEINVFTNGMVFDHKVPMLTDPLEKKGYHTGGFVSLGVLKAEFGLAAGFNTYEDSFNQVNGRYYKYANEVNDVALPWIEKQKDKPFFAWIHYSDPHEPYVPIDAPEDTEAIINGVPFAKFCIARKEKHYLNFMARPGVNVIELRAIVRPGPKKVQQADSKRFIERNLFMTPTEGFTLEFTNDSQEVKLNTGLEARYFAEKATIRVISTRTEPALVSVRVAGGVWAQRIEDARRNYVKEVQYTDKYIGNLWDKLHELGIQDNTIVVITSDHGEGLKTHGILGHVDRLWDEIIRVPLIVYYPWLGKKNAKSDVLVNHLDIMPTILDLLHVKPERGMKGQSLKNEVSLSPVDWITSRPRTRAAHFAYTFAPEAKVNSFAVTDTKTKIIHTPNRAFWQWEAYDLLKDPLERKNIARFQPKVLEGLSTLRGNLERYRKEAEEAHLTRNNPKLDPEQQEMLQNLGYVSGDEDDDNKK